MQRQSGLLGRKGVAGSLRSCGPMRHVRSAVSVRAQARVATAPPGVDKDVTAQLLQSALNVGLSNRLTAHKSINVDVRCTAGGLMNGVFGGMVISGTGWKTPMHLTADAVEVEVGELLLDYGALVNRSALALRNIPTGSCKFRLKCSDLANFIQHRMLQPLVSKAVQGKAFVWDTDSVTISVDEKTGLGRVDWDGQWEGDGATYHVFMIPQAPTRPGAPSPLRVSAKRVSTPSTPSTASTSPTPSAASAGSPAGGAGAGAGPGTAPAAGASAAPAVAQGLANLFTNMSLNLEGIELKSPNLKLLLPELGDAVSEPMLEISMKMKIRGIPPLNMQF